ncbi:MAG: hypothetical protein JJU29_18280 [Verrucomicrobia bacterium]|nr:hypothetical protein [Verrucomicrobiota bacterium]MCH8514015.1 hypothetical protein [Kiritimatiellia bacterium]
MQTKSGVVLILTGLLLLAAGCASRTPAGRPPVPRFGGMLPRPIAIQIFDDRPPIEWGGEFDEAWIYSAFEPAPQVLHFADVVGHSLRRLGAVPTYQMVTSDVKAAEVHYLLRIRLIHWYARWPVNIPRNAEHARVEGRCEIVYELFKGGERVHLGRKRVSPQPFQAPLNVIHAGNVGKIVEDSLVFQLDQAHHQVLDDLMFDLADRWPRFVQ